MQRAAESATSMKPKETGAGDAGPRQPGGQEDGVDHPIQGGGALPQQLGNDHEAVAPQQVGCQGQLKRRISRMKQK